MTCRLLYIRRGTTADRCPTQPTIFTYRISWSLWPAAMADFMACGAATLNPLEAASSQHHGLRRIRLVWLKSVGGTNSCYYSNHGVNGVFFDVVGYQQIARPVAWQWPSQVHRRHPHIIGNIRWLKSVGGTNSYDHYKHLLRTKHNNQLGLLMIRGDVTSAVNVNKDRNNVHNSR